MKQRIVVVPTDFGALSARALEVGVRLARDLGAELMLLHVYAPPAAVFLTGDDGLTATQGTFEAQARGDLVALVGRTKLRYDAVVSRFERGVAWERIVDVAHMVRADFVVMGTHGRSGVARLILGSVTEQVLRRSRSPVVTVSGRALSG